MPTTDDSSTQQVTKAFHQFLAEQSKQSTITTKEEVAAQQKDKELVNTASAWTVDDIVKGLAGLQLTFNRTLGELASTLISEATKLEQIRQAIEIETRHLQELARIELAAKALDVLAQEQQEEARAFEEQSTKQLAAFELEVAAQRESWHREAQDSERAVAAYEESLQKARSQAEADYAYELERKHKVDADKFAADRRKRELEIAETEQDKQAQWVERERAIKDCTKELETIRAQAEALPQQLQEAIQQARDEAAQEATQEAQIKTDLLQKENEANRRVRELKIQTLEQAIVKQAEQIKALSAELSERSRQAQDLASQAIGGTRATNPTSSQKEG
jgi:hypothetical protein